MSQDSQVKFKRRQVYIDKSFQTRFILKFCVILLIGGCLSIGITYFTTSDTITSTFSNSRLVIENTSTAILPSVIFTNLITTGVVILIAVVVILFVSHKIAGPMYRFDKDIQRISQGDFKNHIHIRNGDQFKVMAASLNRMIDSLQSRVNSVKQEMDSFETKLEEHDDCQTLSIEFKKVKTKVDSYFIL
ncbi:MAG: methyl-accepting chemotaxis protein [Thermodesulfobacteriota bacterium]|nr:methyl-accepting chemotaxis protein [Thermodesulfobacteriota bacterium]